MNLLRFFRELRKFATSEEVAPISRRYFAMNGMDGVMTALGIVLGSIVSGIVNPRLILYSGFGAALSIGLSGFVSAYMAEEAERTKSLKELENKMLRSLRRTEVGKKARLAPLWTSIVNSSSPIIFSLIILLPFMVSLSTDFSAVSSAYFSIGFSLLSLFSLGAYLGKVAKRNVIIYGLKMLGAGLVATIILFLFR